MRLVYGGFYKTFFFNGKKMMRMKLTTQLMIVLLAAGFIFNMKAIDDNKNSVGVYEEKRMLRVAINGFGRIGRNFLRGILLDAKALKNIEQDWAPTLEYAINAFVDEWQHRNSVVADLICSYLINSLTHSISETLKDSSLRTESEKKLKNKYVSEIEGFEKKALQRIRGLFKHNIFQYDLPPQSIVNQEIFCEKTWEAHK